MNTIIWYLKQLLPLHYESTYRVKEADGREFTEHCDWRMWFGRCFAIKRLKVCEDNQ